MGGWGNKINPFILFVIVSTRVFHFHINEIIQCLLRLLVLSYHFTVLHITHAVNEKSLHVQIKDVAFN